MDTIRMDNKYNLPELSKLLKQHETDSYSTLKLSRKNVPDEIKNTKLYEGEITALVHNERIMVLKWRDKRIVIVMSSFHYQMDIRKNSQGFDAVKPLEYNKEMRSVYLSDKMLKTYLLERKCGLKCYIKFLKRLLNISVMNSFIIWQTKQPNIDRMVFRLDLIKDFIHKYGWCT